MKPIAPQLAKSESKARFFERLSLSESNKMHRHLYTVMKAEAVTAWTRLGANREALVPELQNDTSLEPPFSFGQVNEVVLHREILRIYAEARPETKIIYELGRDQDGKHEENWIIRWLLWHVFRYRDERNCTGTHRKNNPNNEGPSGLRGSENLSADILNMTVESGPEVGDTITDFEQPTCSGTNVSFARYWDPIREDFRS